MFTLFDTLRQIDPFVQLNDGHTIQTVQARLREINPFDLPEFVIRVDGVGRLMVFRLDWRGCIIHPPILVEQKSADPLPDAAAIPNSGKFGHSMVGFV
jgi:hypothetical protein